ncbi:MAG: sugar transferase [Polyangiaceae bacterium]|nr:sugar transferase [Polyangiaceae bacterium]
MPPFSVRLSKRVLDLAISSVGLCLTAPLFPVVALAIRLDSPGPVFYRQRRAKALDGMQDGIPKVKEFWIIKFRTMRTDAEKATGAVLASKDDDRVTRVGRFLRKTRIDEIPQFLNVLSGEMSLIGPRPERPEILADLAMAIPFFEERLRDVKPGLTGLAQVELEYTGAIPENSVLSMFKKDLQNPYGLDRAEGALADDMRAKLLYDLAYSASLERFSTFASTELRILVKTPLIMLRASGH